MSKNKKNKYNNNININMTGKSKKKCMNYKIKTKKRRNRSIKRYSGGKSAAPVVAPTAPPTTTPSAPATPAPTPEKKTTVPANANTNTNTNTTPKPAETKLKTPEEIMEEVKADRERALNESAIGRSIAIANNAGKEAYEKTKDLAKGVTLGLVENSSKLIGIDLTNKEQTNKKLDEITKTLSDPETQKKVMETVGEAAKTGVVAIKSTKPFLDELIQTASEKGGEVLSKFGEAGVKVATNTLTEVPGLGVVIGTIRSMSNVGEAAINSVNNGSELLNSASDAINASKKNFEQLMNQKDNIEKRTTDSINKFENPLPNKDESKKPQTQTQTQPQTQPPKKGGSHKCNKPVINKNKYKVTKRVRFNL